MKEAEDAAREAAERRTGAEEEWGTAPELAAIRVKAEGLADVQARAARSGEELREIGMQIEAFDAGAIERRTALEAVKAAAGEAEAALAAARAELERAEHADAAAALSAGLKKGDPCPVCGAPLDEVPRRPGDRVLKAAAAAAAAAEKAATRATAAVQKAERDLDAALRDLEEARRLHD